MKKIFRHITKVIILSFVLCLFLPLQAHADIVSDTLVGSWTYSHDGTNIEHRFVSDSYDSSLELCLCDVDLSTTSGFPSGWHYIYLVTSEPTSFGVGCKSLFLSDGTVTDQSSYSSTNYDGIYTTLIYHYDNDSPNTYTWSLPVLSFSSTDDMYNALRDDSFSDTIPVNTDNYSLDKSLGLVKNARWKHLESKDKYNQVLQDAMNLGTGTGDPGNAFYSDIYTRYAEFVQDKCSFATTSTTGIKIGGRYQLQYASRVGFTFAYNLPDLLEHTDFTQQYYKRFGSPKPYPVVNGTNFDANQNIQSLFVQAYQWNDSLPSVGNLKRSLIFKETKYWIDVRIVDTKTKTYGAWYAMDMKNNTAKEVVTDDGDIDSDVSSEDDAGNYTKEEGEGDTFQDAEDNAEEVDHSTHYDQTWYDSIKANTKKSAPAFKNLLSMITGIPSMIATLFSWLPSWVLELVSAFFAIIIVLALLRFVLGS